jgi:hypothetical protein
VPVIASLFSYDTTFCVVVQWSFVPYPDSGTRIQPGHSPARGAQPLSPGACPAAVSRASSRTPRRAASHSSRPAQGLYACAAQHALQDQRPLGYARRGGRYQRYEHDQRCGKLAGLERTEEGIAQIQRGLEIVRDIDSKAYLTSFLAGLAEAYTDAGGGVRPGRPDQRDRRALLRGRAASPQGKAVGAIGRRTAGRDLL